MPYGIPPSSLLEALQQALNPQPSLEDLLMPGTVPQGRDISAPWNPFAAMQPNDLSALEQKLSAGANAKANMESAAILGGRPDIFLNQAMNNPEMAPFAMEKVGAAEKIRGEKVAEQQHQQQLEEDKAAEERAMTERLLPNLREMAPLFAKKIVSGEGLTNEDFQAWQQADYIRQKHAFDTQKQAAMAKQLGDFRKSFKVTILNDDGTTKEVQPDMTNPKHVEQVNAALAQYKSDLEDQYGTGPVPPVQIATPQAQAGGKQYDYEEYTTKEGKKARRYFEVPSTAPKKTTTTTPTQTVSTTTTATPPTTKTAQLPGSLKADIQDYRKYERPKEEFRGTSKEFHEFDAQKAQKQKDIAIKIIQAGIRAGKQPAQIIQMAKADAGIPDDIKKAIEQYAMRF